MNGNATQAVVMNNQKIRNNHPDLGIKDAMKRIHGIGPLTNDRSFIME